MNSGSSSWDPMAFIDSVQELQPRQHFSWPHRNLRVVSTMEHAELELAEETLLDMSHLPDLRPIAEQPRRLHRVNSNNTNQLLQVLLQALESVQSTHRGTDPPPPPPRHQQLRWNRRNSWLDPQPQWQENSTNTNTNPNTFMFMSPRMGPNMWQMRSTAPRFSSSDERVADLLVQTMLSSFGSDADESTSQPASDHARQLLEPVTTPTNANCAICLDPIDTLETTGEQCALLKTPCNHLFHAKCISHWYQVADTCPECRDSLEARVGDARQ